jgi:excisionase family DNA binding protein
MRKREAPRITTPVVIIPRVLTIPDAARYLSATPNFVEELLRSGEVPSFIQGKPRVIDRLELDKYVERRNAEPAKKLTARASNLKVAA